MSDRPLGWALIGCGHVARGHAQSAVELADVEVRGFCDIRADAAQEFHETYGGAYHTTDAEAIFSDPTVDLVCIATSHDSHADLAIAALGAGKHLFLEKPMAMTTADCLRIYDAMNAADRKLMINLSIRFSGAAREIKKRLGVPKVSHGQCMQGHVDLTTWRWHPEQGGGPLYDVGVHAVDLLCWVHDSDPVEVYAVGGQVTHPGQLGDADLVDTAVATIRFANGSASTFLMSDAGFSEVVSKWFFEFFDGEQAAVLDHHFTRVTFTRPDGDTGNLVTEELTPPPMERLPDLVAAIRHDAEPYIPVRAGIVSTLLVEKITESIQTRRPQAIEIPI